MASDPSQPTTETPVGTDNGGSPSGADIAASLAETLAPDAAAATLPVEAVRNSPEYLALQEQMRLAARQAGTYRAELEKARAQQEAARQAAEAQRIEATQREMTQALGDKAQDFSQFAQLLQADPVAAAKRFAEMSVVQSPVVPTLAPADAEPDDGGEQVPNAPRPPSMGVSATTPLGQTQQQSRDERISLLDEDVEKVRTANQSLSTRARVTDRMRAEAIGKFLRRSYIEQLGVDPELTLNQRG